MNKLRLKDIIKTPEVVGIGNPVEVKGWVRSRRGNNFVQFIALNDGSIVTNLQVVAKESPGYGAVSYPPNLEHAYVYFTEIRDKE